MVDKDIGCNPQGLCKICLNEVDPRKAPALGSFPLFRAHPRRMIEWVHNSCARDAIEKWIIIKEKKQNGK